ncbi:MAG: hypothetical protein RLZZ420_267, partial [Bacteroidota bacterium]
NALTDTPILQKLMARFRVSINLQDTDVQTVIRKTILEKKPTAISPINTKLEASLGEISRNLEGTTFGYLTADRNMLSADYPLLPSTRKFWYKVLQVVDVAGTSGQLRNQLRLIDDSLKSIANHELGQVVPADFIFTQTRADLIQAGLLLNDTSNLIQSKKAMGGDALVEGRILSAVFLLDQVSSTIPDTGLKSNENTIADLLIDDLNLSSDAFRTKIKTLVAKLVDEKALMPVQDEFKLQTKIGTEWEQEFTKHYIKLNNTGDDQIQAMRRERMIAHFKEKLRTISIAQGNSRMIREFELWDKDTVPSTEHKLNLWIRDGWFENETLVENEIRAAGNNSSLAYVFIKKIRDTDLRVEIIKCLAAGLAINSMGLPSTPEAEQAKRSMETRQAQARVAIQELVEKICDEAIVFLAGGNKIQSGTLKENIQEALNSIADRQFPDFKSKADYPNWGQALSRALNGNPDALTAINYSGEVDKHPVAAEILRFMGNSSKTGRDIRNQFMKAPYGWPQDAVDSILILLKNLEHISTSETDLKVAKINQANFKKEVHILGAKEKIGIRKLFQDAGITCPPNQEIFPFSNTFLERLKKLSEEASGNAPRPEPFNIAFIRDIENLDGNERLLEILQQKDLLNSHFTDWTAKAKMVGEREPQWNLLVELIGHAPDDAALENIKNQADAIKDSRLLLQEPDPVKPILTDISNRLLEILNNRKRQFIEIYTQLMADLQANQYFKKLTPEQKHTILAKNQLLLKPDIKDLDAHALLNQLNKASLYAWDTKIAALPGQFQAALEQAVLLSAPQARTFSLPRRTITSPNELENYLTELQTALEAMLSESSSIILK